MFFLALFGSCSAARNCRWRWRRHAWPAARKYRPAFLDNLLAVSAALAILCYALFTVQRNPTLVITVLPVVYCVTRYLAHVMVHGRGESPDALLLSDWRMWVGVVCWLGLCVGILYSDVQLFTNTAEKPPMKHRLRR